jgi:hypothetical protein
VTPTWPSVSGRRGASDETGGGANPSQNEGTVMPACRRSNDYDTRIKSRSMTFVLGYVQMSLSGECRWSAKLYCSTNHLNLTTVARLRFAL